MIVRALVLSHNFTITYQLSVPGPGKIRMLKDAELKAVPREERYGRHGDIKPENILRFKSTLKTGDERGVLRIADFGVGRIHGRDSGSRINPDTIQRSLTYEPPEYKLRRPVSRAYNIWSLASIYLELITGLTPLSYAARNCRKAVVKLLLERGADVEARDKDSLTPLLLHAAWNGHKAIVRLLLEKGADIEVRDEDGRTPLLLYAAWNGYEAIARLLLEKGVDVEPRDPGQERSKS